MNEGKAFSKRGKTFLGIAGALGAVLLVAAALLVASALGESNQMRQGIHEGFELRGTYAEVDHQRQQTVLFSFQTGNEQIWQAQEVEAGNAAVGGGTFEETIDPTSTCSKTMTALRWAALILPIPIGTARACCSSSMRTMT